MMADCAREMQRRGEEGRYGGALIPAEIEDMDGDEFRDVTEDF